MTEIVSKMRGELRDILRDSVVDYTTKSRDKWLFDWPSQIILVVNQVFWCQEVEQVRDAIAGCVWVPNIQGCPPWLVYCIHYHCKVLLLVACMLFSMNPSVDIAACHCRHSRQWARATSKPWPSTMTSKSSS